MEQDAGGGPGRLLKLALVQGRICAGPAAAVRCPPAAGEVQARVHTHPHPQEEAGNRTEQNREHCQRAGRRAQRRPLHFSNLELPDLLAWGSILHVRVREEQFTPQRREALVGHWRGGVRVGGGGGGALGLGDYLQKGSKEGSKPLCLQTRI